jgi:hypothetical protein
VLYLAQWQEYNVACHPPKEDIMEASLPYLASPGSVKNALEKIRQAATPDRVTRDFVTTKLGIKGGTGYALIPFFKKIGLINADGTPSEYYKQFRNPATGGGAIAAAIKNGYKALGQVNEYFFDLKDNDLFALIVQVTGTEADSPVAKLTFSTLKTLKKFANFETPVSGEKLLDSEVPREGFREEPVLPRPIDSVNRGLSLSYTINLNLPATSDQAVFNAIFRSLKEHILSNAE